MIWGLRKGFAAVSTDTGHNSSSSDGSFLSFPEQSINWGHRALHASVVAAKQILSSYYGISMDGKIYSYYAGCSTGGRQGINAAERYPEDFDGVLSGSAIAWQTHTSGWQVYVALLQYPSTSTTYIPAAKWPFIASAVLQQCDNLDGVVDGIIMDPSKCDINFDALKCGSGILNATACLSDDQTANLQRMYTPWRANGTTGDLVNPGISPSGEASFSYLMNGDEPQFGPTFYRNGVYNDSHWDWRTLTVNDVYTADSINPGGSNAYNPDLRPFEARGGKIVQYHGYSDPLIPSLNAPAWYDTIHAFYGSLGRDQEVQDFYRLFMVPGMGHCSGGSGAWVLDGASQDGLIPPVDDASHSMLYSLVQWVEGGGSAAPESVIATKYAGDVMPSVKFQRPLCRWPVVAEYDGVGDVNAASSWACPAVGVY
ncbi:putative Carboxylic ester hydrolase [Seiridium cardinale]|uniref:Carboxylic ester hydrolase n=1 Tax=Seiridium cardinale TaxID=138064 RepID=A0ABR2XCH2_9PEZI